MSLNGAMNAAVTGMSAQAARTQSVAANISTLGATAQKRELVPFLPMVAGNNTTAGVFYYKERDMSQGLIEPSNSNLHWAIAGNGFYSVAVNKDNTQLGQEYLHSRNGEFYKDYEGYLRTPSDHYLMGVAVDQYGLIPSSFAGTLTEQEAISISQVKPYYRPTQAIDIVATLPASKKVGSVFYSNVPVVDSLGGKHNLTVNWTKTAAMVWTATVECEHTSVIRETNGSGPTPYSITIEFDTNGNLKYIDGQNVNGAPDIYLVWDPTQTNSNPTNSTLKFNFGTIGNNDGLALAGDAFVPTKEQHDGVETGNFTKVSINENGLIEAHFSNGGSTPIYQLLLANFDNPAALEAREGGTYIQTTDSGPYSLRKPKEAGLGKIVPNAREASNADSATEFTTLISSQSNFGLNAKCVQTANEMLEVLQSIKR